MLICTYRTPGTAAAAQVLAQDVHRLSPDARCVIVDLCVGAPDVEHATLVDPLTFDGLELLDLAMISTSAEMFAQFLAPSTMSWAIAQDPEAMFLAPTSLLITPPEQFVELARPTGLAFVSRISSRIADDGLQPTPRDVLSRGITNDSIWAATADALPALSWWRARFRAQELARRTGGREEERHARRLKTSHPVPWIDAVSHLFPAFVGADTGWGESAWTLSNEDSLVHSLDLDAFDIERPWMLDWGCSDTPRFRWSEHRELWRACQAWAQKVRAVSGAETPRYRFDYLPDGTEVDQLMRFSYAASLERDEERPPNPFAEAAPDGGSFLDWLGETPGNSRLSRYLVNVWHDRVDLQIAFPNAPHTDAEAFGTWAREHGAVEESIPERFLPPEPEPEPEAELEAEGGSVADPAQMPDDAAPPTEHVEPAAPEPTPGVLVSGYLSSVMGLGEAARLVADAVAQTGLEHATFTYTAAAAEQADEFLERGDHAVTYDTHIACVNIDTFCTFVNDLGPTFFDGRHTIGLWFWETSIIPDAMLPAFDHVDEIWVAAEYVGDIMRRYTDKPIRVYPQPVPVPARGTATRAELGLPDAFTFLFAFDFNSVIERKNPLGLVEAFAAAFEPNEGPQLVLKTINGGKRLSDFERLVTTTFNRPDIHVVDAFFPTWKRDAWTAECDCYVSLHRSEGFGLTMAEAMACGKPVIASRYSANIDFMNDDNSLLVDVVETTVPAGCEPYPEGAVWASPDTAHAARLMRQVYDDAELRERIGAAARTSIMTRHTAAAMSEWVQREMLDRRDRAAALSLEVAAATEARAEAEAVVLPEPTRATRRPLRRVAARLRR